MHATIDNVMDYLKSQMNKTIDHMNSDFAAIRTGKASPALVENIAIDYYGTATKLKELAGITTPEPRLLVIQPYDPASVHTIEKAIGASNLGITPVSDGKILRLPIPELSEERRASLTKQVQTRSEETRITIRNIRRDGNEIVKKAQKNTEITEDDLKDMLEDIQKLTDGKIKDVDLILKQKEDELMSM